MMYPKDIILINYQEARKRIEERVEGFRAQYSQDYVIIYQAYKDEIADYALEHQKLGGDSFSFLRMLWIKPSFSWMMFRSGWAQKDNQKRILAVFLQRKFFDHLIKSAIPTMFDPKRFSDKTSWRKALKRSDVIVQMDTDKNYYSYPVSTRAIQLGLRRRELREFALEKILKIEDITEYVLEQHKHLRNKRFDLIKFPLETKYETFR